MPEDLEGQLKELRRRRDELARELESLNSKKELTRHEVERKKILEREAVEIMDRIVQLEFLSGERRSHAPRRCLIPTCEQRSAARADYRSLAGLCLGAL